MNIEQTMSKVSSNYNVLLVFSRGDYWCQIYYHVSYRQFNLLL